MRLSNAFPGMAALAGAAQAAQDLLFYQGMTFTEYKQALALNYTVHIASPTEWYAMTTADFAQYKAIVVPDPDCGSLDQIQFLNDTRAAWSPAVAGNVIVMATDTTYHASTQSGAVALMKDGIRFAASGTAGTGLYLSLSCYYDDQSFATVDALAHFGMFVAQGRLSCYDSAHIVATVQPSRTTDPHSQFRLITDSNLSNWSCSAHALISQYPSEGPNGFVPLAVLEDAASAPHAVGIHAFAGGVKGVPYIVARGVTPVGCGDGVVAPQDDGQNLCRSAKELCLLISSVKHGIGFEPSVEHKVKHRVKHRAEHGAEHRFQCIDPNVQSAHRDRNDDDDNDSDRHFCGSFH
ncbi:hypothetical protein SEPCBS119000_004968 [Sporothrix epigloea]|uniref:Uncharacterized protein n=1 Tax=Sporothrix epigloea TaxID=1892477 RepID=A0ABP0DV26_9PEZI